MPALKDLKKTAPFAIKKVQTNNKFNFIKGLEKLWKTKKSSNSLTILKKPR